MASSKETAPPGSILLVIHDFVARSGDELSLAKGDRIELIERDDEFGDGWFLGRHMANGSTGLFPEVYTTPAPKGTLNNAINSRRASDGPPKATQPVPNTVPSQQRHVSASAVQRPATSESQQPFAGPLRTSLPTQPAAPRAPTLTTDSPVMNETLSVIDEHITDMNTPRSSYANGGNKRDTIGSVYSNSQSIQRVSYIPGHETDEDDNHLHTHDEVFAWTPEQVAEYLEDHGVEKMHCDVFREQEISGEVLLAMDQSSLFIKEFELGPVGRRLKTWGKIKALQEEIKQSALAEAARPMSGYADSQDGNRAGSLARNRSSTIGTMMPRALDASSRQSGVEGSPTGSATNLPIPGTTAPPKVAGASPLQTMTSISRPENIQRPSAQNIRMSQSRRHSSIDSTNESTNFRSGHRKQPSMDQKWSMSQQPPAVTRLGHSYALSADSSIAPQANRSSIMLTQEPLEEDEKGYFSSTELEKRSSRVGKPRVLQKKESPAHSRTTSFVNVGRFSSGSPKPGRVLSSEGMPPGSPSPRATPSGSIFGAWNNKLGNFRSATSPTTTTLDKPMNKVGDSSSPVVTKLEYNNTPSVGASSPTVQLHSESSSVNQPAPSPSSGTFGFLGQKFRNPANRATSDAVTKDEKTAVGPAIPPTTKEEPPYTGRTGSTTPSTEAQSVDYQKSEDPSRTSTGSGPKLMPPPTSVRRRGLKTKKATSAYTRGLEQKTPAEAMTNCDYSGWMKKKSGSLMTTWKPRLFILRGRRLSYYYKDDDTEEKGLIDISFHRVLPAHKEMLTGFHAAATGAGRVAPTPTSPTSLTTPTSAEQDLKEHPPFPGENDEGLFIFKLVPPKAGLSKAVNFTKPTVHYFAVNSRQEGRLWMAALMKATIDRDDDGLVTTTYNQKTISLAKARARKERPPALREENAAGDAEELDEDDESALEQPGLGIEGFAGQARGDKATTSGLGPTVAGAEQFDRGDAASSITKSSIITGSEYDNGEEHSAPTARSHETAGAVFS